MDIGLTNQLPLEILESIVDIIAATDGVSLPSVKACSLAARSFLPRTRSHIFGTITIEESTASRFQRLISQSPDVANYVKTLIYFMGRNDWAVEGFAKALNSLTSLKSLTIEGNQTSLPWMELELREIILNLMHLPTLYRLRLCSIRSFLVSDIIPSVGLKSLELFRLLTPLAGWDIATYHNQPPRLESYETRSTNDDFLMLLCTARRNNGFPVVDMTRLKKVSIQVLGNLVAVKELLQRCAHLTEVHLLMSEDLLNSVSFRGLFVPSLQTLRHIYIGLHVCDGQAPVRPLVSELASMTGKNILESITTSVTTWADIEWLRSSEWLILDQVFTQSTSGWKRLKLFSLHMRIKSSQVGRSTDIKALRRLAETQLSGLAGSKDIRFDFKVSVSSYHTI